MKAWSVALAGLSLASCNGILGIEERSGRPDAGAVRDAEGLASDGSRGDGAGSSAYAASVLADGPVLYLRLGEHGGAVAHDEVHRFDGAYPTLGVTFGVAGALVGDADGAALFEGTSRLTMPPGVDFAGRLPLSIEVWLKRDAAAGANAFVVDHESWTGARGGWNLIAGSDGIVIERYGSTSASSTAPASPAGEWHHVVATWDGTNQRIFTDGQLEAQGGATDVSVPTLSEGWSIAGQNCECSGNFYIGAIDELAIYDHALGQDRIRAHLRAAGR